MPEDEESQNRWQEAWDDVSGKELDPAGVRAARSLEIKHVNMKKGMEEDTQGRCQKTRMQDDWDAMGRHR